MTAAPIGSAVPDRAGSDTAALVLTTTPAATRTGGPTT